MFEKLTEIVKLCNIQSVMVFDEKREKTVLPDSLGSLFVVYDFDLNRLESELDVDAFLVFDQMIAHQAEFNKMIDYCKRTGAGIYDIEGRNLYEICRNAAERKWSSYEELLSEIESHDYISFDIFDTLLSRKVMLPEDVFEIVRRNRASAGAVIEDFKEKRLKAQESLGLTNPDIYEIYQRLQKLFEVSPEVAKEYLEEEIRVEKRVLVPREKMVELYRRCAQMGKEVFLVTDMYLPENILREILEQNQIPIYGKLYVSCSVKQLKLQGLLEYYKGEQNGRAFLHIGDHLIHDGICASLAGVDYCLIPAGYKYALQTPMKKAIQTATSLEEHMILGLAINSLFNNPFSGTGADRDGECCITVENDAVYAYAFLAAYVTRMVIWIYEQSRGEQYRGILFAARDGYLLKQMYDLLVECYKEQDMPEGIYFYTSRKAAVMPCVKDEQYINMIMNMYENRDKEEMMREGFALSDDKVLAYHPDEYEVWQLYGWKHLDSIVERAEEAKRNYLRYMGNLRLAMGWKYAFVDFVSSGTTQKSLVQYTPFEIEGLYASYTDDKNESISVKSMTADKDSYFSRNYKRFETFLTSFEPSVVFFDEKGQPVFAEEQRTKEELAYVRNMQAGCKLFFKEFIDLAGIPESDSIGIEVLDELFEVSSRVEIVNTDSIIHRLSLIDDWSNQRNLL